MRNGLLTTLGAIAIAVAGCDRRRPPTGSQARANDRDRRRTIPQRERGLGRAAALRVSLFWRLVGTCGSLKKYRDDLPSTAAGPPEGIQCPCWVFAVQKRSAEQIAEKSIPS